MRKARKSTTKGGARKAAARSRPVATRAERQPKPPRPVPVVALEPEPDLALEPLTPAFLLRTAEDLRLPTVAIPAQVLTVDGREVRGRIFVPAAAHSHEGAMRAEEWMNEGSAFFPFLPDEASAPALLNRDEVLILTVPAHADEGGLVEGTEQLDRRVHIDCRGRRLSGLVRIDLPEERRRVLDYLNSPGRFLTLRDGERHHLVQKNRITRVQETREE